MKTIVFEISYLGICGCGGRKFERTIEMRETQTLQGLHNVIIKELRWDDDHLYSFFMDNKAWSNNKECEYARPGQEEPLDSNSASIPLNKLGLKPEQKFLYIFDFGDDHQFRIQVKGFGKTTAGKKYPLTAEAKGKAFMQYPTHKKSE